MRSDDPGLKSDKERRDAQQRELDRKNALGVLKQEGNQLYRRLCKKLNWIYLQEDEEDQIEILIKKP